MRRALLGVAVLGGVMLLGAGCGAVGDLLGGKSGAGGSGSGDSGGSGTDVGGGDLVDGGTPSCNEQTTWRETTGFQPLSDAEALARLCSKPEQRALNTTANGVVPSKADLATFLAAKDNYGNTQLQSNPYNAYVTGGCAGHTTDEIIQCTAAKWGIPADWLRAEYVVESNWQQIDMESKQPEMGDHVQVTAAQAAMYPSFSRDSKNANYVWQSLGLTQERWTPTGSVGPGTEPLRWKSTAFNADYQAATVRYYYDDPQGLRSSWGDDYTAGQQWNSIGGWMNPYPWNNSDQTSYVSACKQKLADMPWTKSDF